MKYKMVAISVCLIITLFTCYLIDDEIMMKRYQKLSLDILQSYEIEKISYQKAFGLYQSISIQLNHFLKRYPYKTLVKSLKKSESFIDGDTLQSFQKRIELLQTKANDLAERESVSSNLFASLLYLAKHLEADIYETYSVRLQDIKDQLILDTLGIDLSKMYDMTNNNSYTESFINSIKLNYRNELLSNIAYLFAQSGKYDEAKQMILLFSEESENQAFRIVQLARMMIHEGKIEEAKNLLAYAETLTRKKSQNPHKIMNTRYAIAETYLLMGLNEQYYKMITEIIDSVDNIFENHSSASIGSFTIDLMKVVDTLIQLKNEKLALKLVLAVFQYFEQQAIQSSYAGDIGILSKLMFHLLALKREDLADKVPSFIQYDDDQAMLYVAVAECFIQKQLSLANDYILKAKNCIKESKWLEHHLRVSLKIHSLYEANGKHEEAAMELQTTVDYLSKGNHITYDKCLDPNLELKNYLYTDVMERLLRNDLVNQARLIADSVKYHDDHVELLYRIAVYYIKNGQIDQAVDIAKQIQGGYRWDSRSEVYYAIAKHFTDRNEMDKALYYIEQANDSNKMDFFLELTERAIQKQQIQKAKEYLYKSYQYFDHHYDIQDHYRQESELIRLCGELGDETILQNEDLGYKEGRRSSIGEYFIQHINTEKFSYYLSLMTQGDSKDRLLLSACSSNASEAIQQIALKEAVESSNTIVISYYYTNQATRLIEKKEFEKALALVEKIDLMYDKVQVLALLSIYWEQPDLTGYNKEILLRILASVD